MLYCPYSCVFAESILTVSQKTTRRLQFISQIKGEQTVSTELRSSFLSNAFLRGALLILVLIVVCLPFTACAPPPPRPMPKYSLPIDARNGNQLGCNTDDIGDTTDTARIDPEWFRLDIDQNQTILEGTIPPPPNPEASSAQAPSEFSEEDTPWNHYTHDMTFKVTPDLKYTGLLSTYWRMDAQGKLTKETHSNMEVEWEAGSFSDKFYWPAVGDRIWVEGHWIFDCGHNGLNKDSNSTEVDKCGLNCVKYDTEIHPPKALVVYRLNRGGLFNLNGHDTWTPMTQADIFVSGDGGGANDVCSLINRNINLGIVIINHVDPCQHTGPINRVNDKNYVFDIYPPGTDYNNYEDSLAFRVNTPVSGSSVKGQQLGSVVFKYYHTGYPNEVQPKFCPIDETTPPPTQHETDCPKEVPTNPTRIRVILPFNGWPGAQTFRGTIQVGWNIPLETPIRTFIVRLHEFKVIHSGETIFTDPKSGITFPIPGNWEVYVNVGGRYEYMNDFTPDKTDPKCNVGYSLNGVLDGDCFQFDSSPWYVTVQAGKPIHIAVGGYVSNRVDGDYCKDPAGCDPTITAANDLSEYNDSRIGTMEFDIRNTSGLYSLTTSQTTSQLPDNGAAVQGQGAVVQYEATFSVESVPTPLPPN